MPIKRLFKEIEVHVIEEASRIYIDIEDLSRVIYDLCFAKTKLDIHTLRVFKRLIDSIQKTYKVLKTSDDYDVNSFESQVELSRKKVKSLINKSYDISQKDRDITVSGMDELDEFLAPEAEAIPLSKEETVELITSTIEGLIEPFLASLQDAPREAERQEKPKAKDKPTPKAKPKKDQPKKKESIEEILDVEEEDSIEEALNELE